MYRTRCTVRYACLLFRYSDNIFTIFLTLNPDLQREPSRRQTLNKFDYPKNLHHFEKDLLINEVDGVIDWYDDSPQGEILDGVAIDYRIKAKQSAHLKYERYFPDTLTEKVFNDLLGFRSLCDSYENVQLFKSEPHFRIADMTSGKSNDDGYRGIHVYFQIDHSHYPIEIQYNTYYDRQLNNWLHTYLYKKGYELSVGKQMRIEYEKGNIKTDEEFQEVLSYVLSNSKGY